MQRYLDKIEEERQIVLRQQEEAATKKRAEIEARIKADEDAKKAAEPKDANMTDADQPETEETVE